MTHKPGARRLFWLFIFATSALGVGCRTIAPTSKVRDADASHATSLQLGACDTTPVLCPSRTPAPLAAADTAPAMITVCTAVDGSGTPVASGEGATPCYSGNDLQSTLCQMNPPLNPPDYQATCSSVLFADAPSNGAPTSVQSIQIPACDAALAACPTDTIFGGLTCAATDDQGHVVATVRGNNLCVAANSLQQRLCDLTPAVDPSTLASTCSAVVAPTTATAALSTASGNDACAPSTSLHCAPGFHIDPASCLQATGTSGATNPTYGRCLPSNNGLALDDASSTPGMIHGVKGTDAYGQLGVCAPLAAGVNCQADADDDAFVATCHGSGQRPARCNDCSVLCVSESTAN